MKNYVVKSGAGIVVFFGMMLVLCGGVGTFGSIVNMFIGGGFELYGLMSLCFGIFLVWISITNEDEEKILETNQPK